jgi:DNA-binding LacI/PurR family transcriptional regulator
MNYSPLEDEVAALSFPVVDVPVGRIVPGICHVMCDNEAVAIMATDHLLELGLKSFACFRRIRGDRGGRVGRAAVAMLKIDTDLRKSVIGEL